MHSTLPFLLLIAAAPLTRASDATEVRHRPLADAPAFVEQLDRWMTDTLTTLEVVPGIAVTVVVDDEVALARAWGTSDLRTGAPATEDTQFYIASATKSFTALAASVLDARGVLDLDSSFAEHLHGVELERSLRPGDVKLRDFLSHTSGIANDPIGYRVAYSGVHDPETLWALLEDCTPASGAPLGTFRYTNVGYNILGMIIDRETGVTWQEHLRELLFEPLGMERTTAYASLGREKGWTVAAPHHGVHADGVRRLYLEKQDNTMQSAGGMMTTARDVARWLELQLNEGVVDGHQVVDAALVRATHEAAAQTGPPSGMPLGQTAYGLGWSVGSHRGREARFHGGGFAGFRSLISFMPEDGVAVAVMVNESSVGGELLRATLEMSYDWWLGEEVRMSAATAALLESREKFTTRIAADVAARAEREWQLSLPRAAYTGTFTSDWYGDVVITELDGELHFQNGNLHCVATPYTRPETMRVEPIPGRGMVVRFHSDEGSVDELEMDGDWFERAD